MENQQTVKKSAKGRKTLVAFGLFFIILGVFLGAFTCSFHLMMYADTKAEEGSVEEQNKELKQQVQLLEDKLVITENELEHYKSKTGESTPATRSSSNSSGSSKSSGSSDSSGSSKSSNNSSKNSNSNSSTSSSSSSSSNKTSSSTISD